MAAAPTSCPQCGTLLHGASVVEGLCRACLLELALLPDEAETEAQREPERVILQPRSRPGRPRTLSPVDSGVVAANWAMPAELLRQASRRLRLAAISIGLTWSVSIAINHLIDAAGWHTYLNLPLEDVIAALMVVASAVVFQLASTGLPPARLLRLSTGYQIVGAFAISLGDNLEPLVTGGLPLANLSWLCVWIVTFPLFVPASPRWALLAGLASASTWPLAYLVGRALGNPPAAGHILAMNFLENYIAAGLAMYSTIVIRGLQELGCYELVKKLDHGGMGEIWKARHRMLARPVAIKLIRPELLGAKSPLEAAALVRRFQREAEATAALQSSHTVALHDFGVTPEGAFYYVMDLLDGLDLSTLVRRHGRVPPERAIHFLAQACESLAEAHAAGLIHRDVKPANMIACQWGLKWDHVKVLDFGLVKSTFNLANDEDLTSDGVIGTPSCMAPEAALGDPAQDHKVDVYGLGCVAYWLLTGEHVFTGRSAHEVLNHHINTPPVPPSKRAGVNVPEQLETLVLSCLAKKPDERPSAELLAAQLAECETAGGWTPARARVWWERSRGGASPNPHAYDGPDMDDPTLLKPSA